MTLLKWSSLTAEQKVYVRQLRTVGWSLYDAIIQAACCA